jgi:hypothetical protein
MFFTIIADCFPKRRKQLILVMGKKLPSCVRGNVINYIFELNFKGLANHMTAAQSSG